MKSIANNRNYSIDFLKIICTILIVFHHYQQDTNITFNNCINFYYGKIYFGYIVEFFFLISGLFMFRVEQKILENSKYKDYIIKRVKRFLPLMCISAVIYTGVLIYFTKILKLNYFDTHPTLFGTIITALGIQNGGVFNQNFMVNNPTWYISILFICYTIFYFLVKISKKKNISIIELSAIMVLIGIGAYNYQFNLPFLNNECARGYYAFFFGVIVGKLLYTDTIKINKKLVFLSILTIISIVVFTVFYYSFVLDGYNFILTFLLYPAIIIVLNAKYIEKIFHFKFMETISRISFDVYIWHNTLLLVLCIFINKFTIPYETPQSMLIFTLICYIVGTISYYLIDKNFQKYFNKK